jgi:hypothetical protein
MSETRWRARVRRLAYSPRVPFEMRCRVAYWSRRRRWATARPVTFSQKLLWKMTEDRRPLLTTFADKVAVRDYVARLVGREVLPELYAAVADPAELQAAQLPDHFVVKPSHASGMIGIVADKTVLEGLGIDGPARYTTNHFVAAREELDWERLVATCRHWLAVRYADIELEWAYRSIPPRIVAEELLLDEQRHIPADYKFYVFHGQARFLEIHQDRFTEYRWSFVHPDWTPVDVPIVGNGKRVEAPSRRPGSMDEMVEIAETLGQETDFVRVDLYDVSGRIVFGELTSYPAGLYAAERFTPKAWDIELGRYWTVPRRYR